MTCVKTYLSQILFIIVTSHPTLKTHVVNLKRDTEDLSCDLQRLEVRGRLDLKLSSLLCV